MVAACGSEAEVHRLPVLVSKAGRMRFPADVLEVWGITAVDSVEIPALGTMNET